MSEQSWPGTKSLLLHNKNQLIYQYGENEKATHLTCLLTITPRERLATLYTWPVLPWYALYGIPL